jgi:hypothetical protein
MQINACRRQSAQVPASTEISGQDLSIKTALARAKKREGGMPHIYSDRIPTGLTLNPEKVCYIIIKAREFDAKVEPVEPDPGSNPSDDAGIEILEDYPDDPTLEELVDAIDGMNEDEQIELVALAWLGRGDYSRKEWRDAVVLARDRHNDKTSRYLAGMPMLGDYLEEGMAVFGKSCDAVELAHL